MTKRKATRSSGKKPQHYCTVKRHGHLEKFDERKVYASIYSACASAHLSHRDSEKVADKISKHIHTMAKKVATIDSDAIFKQVTKELRKVNKDAAFMYETHRDIS